MDRRDVDNAASTYLHHLRDGVFCSQVEGLDQNIHAFLPDCFRYLQGSPTSRGTHFEGIVYKDVQSVPSLDCSPRLPGECPYPGIHRCAEPGRHHPLHGFWRRWLRPCPGRCLLSGPSRPPQPAAWKSLRPNPVHLRSQSRLAFLISASFFTVLAFQVSPVVAVTSRPPSVELTARRNKTSAWRPKLRQDLQVSPVHSCPLLVWASWKARRILSGNLVRKRAFFHRS